MVGRPLNEDEERGISLMSRINDKILLVAIGIWIGTSTAFGQAEFGLGSKGLLIIGIGYKF